MERIIRLREVMSLTGLSRTSTYEHISRGVFPKPIPLGGRMIGWRASEVDAVIKARVRGSTDEEIRVLVNSIIAGRREVA